MSGKKLFTSFNLNQNKYELHKHKFNDSSDIKICLEMKKIAAIYTEASSYTYTVKPKLVWRFIIYSVPVDENQIIKILF